MGRGIRHSALLDPPGREGTVAQRGDDDPDAALRPEPGDLLLGHREAHLDAPDPQQRHHRNARQHIFPGRCLPPAHDARERRAQRTVFEVLPGDSEGRFGLTKPRLRLDPLDFGQALGVVKLPQTLAGILCLVQGRFGGLEGPARRGGVELGQQLPLPHPLPLVREGAGDGSGNREAQGGRRLLLDRADINRGSGIGRRCGDDGCDPQRIDRPGLFGG